MNTSRKATKVLQCMKCDDVYMKVGDTDIRLAFPRRVTLDPYGMPLLGTCPKHSRSDV